MGRLVNTASAGFIWKRKPATLRTSSVSSRMQMFSCYEQQQGYAAQQNKAMRHSSAALAIILHGCSSTSAIPDGEQLFTGLKKINYTDYKASDYAETTKIEIENVLPPLPTPHFWKQLLPKPLPYQAGYGFGTHSPRTAVPWLVGFVCSVRGRSS